MYFLLKVKLGCHNKLQGAKPKALRYDIRPLGWRLASGQHVEEETDWTTARGPQKASMLQTASRTKYG